MKKEAQHKEQRICYSLKEYLETENENYYDVLDLPENEEINDLGNAALHRATSAGNLEIVKYLLEIGVDINVIGNHSVTAAELAAIRGRLNVLEYLAEKGASLEPHVSDDGSEKNSLFYAIQHKHLEVVQFLVEHGVKLIVPEGEEDCTRSVDDEEIHKLIEAGRWADNVEDNTNDFDVEMRDIIVSRLIHRLSMEDDVSIKGNLLEKLKICSGCKNTHYNYSQLKQFFCNKLPENLSDKLISKMEESIEDIMTFEAALMHLSGDVITAMSLYDIISEKDVSHEALEAELLDFYCRIYPDCADLIQKYSKNEQDEDGNSLFTLEDQSTLLENLKNNAGQYLNTLKKTDLVEERTGNILEYLLNADKYLLLPTELTELVSDIIHPDESSSESEIIGESAEQNLDIE